MAKYTCNDDDINNLNVHDKVNYNYYLLNYNVDKIQEVTEGINAINEMRQPMNLLQMLKKPSKVITLLTAIIILLLIVSLIIFIIIYYILGFKKEWAIKKNIITAGMPIVLGIVFIIGLIGVLYSIVLKEVIKAYVMIPQNVVSKNSKNKDKDSDNTISSENNQTCYL
jgi:hypothetical protein